MTYFGRGRVDVLSKTCFERFDSHGVSDEGSTLVTPPGNGKATGSSCSIIHAPTDEADLKKLAKLPFVFGADRKKS